MAQPLEISAQDLKRRLDGAEKLFLLDCREPHEYNTARIEGAELIPMRTVPANLQRIEAEADAKHVVVYCHHGMRSLQTAQWLREQGIADCQSLAGGIDAWSCTIDPKVPRY